MGGQVSRATWTSVRFLLFDAARSSEPRIRFLRLELAPVGGQRSPPRLACSERDQISDGPTREPGCSGSGDAAVVSRAVGAFAAMVARALYEVTTLRGRGTPTGRRFSINRSSSAIGSSVGTDHGFAAVGMLASGTPKCASSFSLVTSSPDPCSCGSRSREWRRLLLVREQTVDFPSASPGQGGAGAAVAVVVDHRSPVGSAIDRHSYSGPGRPETDAVVDNRGLGQPGLHGSAAGEDVGCGLLIRLQAAVAIEGGAAEDHGVAVGVDAEQVR